MNVFENISRSSSANSNEIFLETIFFMRYGELLIFVNEFTIFFLIIILGGATLLLYKLDGHGFNFQSH